MNDTEKREKQDQANKKIIKWAGGLIVLTLLLTSFIKPADNECDYRGAYFYFSAVGVKYFKSPSTVKFPYYDEAQIVSSDCQEYNIRTYADSKNNFNATVRSIVVGKVRKINKNWELVDINISTY